MDPLEQALNRELRRPGLKVGLLASFLFFQSAVFLSIVYVGCVVLLSVIAIYLVWRRIKPRLF